MIIPLGLNAAFVAGTQALGRRLDPYFGFNFLVEIDGILVGGFTKVEGLESTIETEDREEGGVNKYVHKVFKRTTFPNLVLSHGLTDFDSLWSWYDRVSRGIIKRKNGSIMLLDRQRLPAMWWDFRDALPVKWSGPSLDANSGEIAVERIELVHRGLTKPALSQATSAARGIAALVKKP